MHTALRPYTSFRGILPILVLSTLLFGCKTAEPGAYTRVSLSSDYPKGVGIRVLLLPVKVEGQPDFTESQSMTDAMGQRLMEIGYRVIGWDEARSRALAAGSIIGNDMSEADVMRVARDLGVEGIAKGRLTMEYQPGRSESGTKIETLTRTEIKNGTHRKDTVIIREDVPTSYSHSSEGRYYAASQSLNLIAVSNGEMLLSASVQNGPYDMTDELAAGISKAVR
jgi:hypothetical protein